MSELSNQVEQLITKIDGVAERAWGKGFTVMKIDIADWVELTRLLREAEGAKAKS